MSNLENNKKKLKFLMFPVIISQLFYLPKFKKYSFLDKFIYINIVISMLLVFIQNIYISDFSRYFVKLIFFSTLFSRNLLLNSIVLYFSFFAVLTRLYYKECLLKFSDNKFTNEKTIINKIKIYFFSLSEIQITLIYFGFFLFFFVKSLLIYNKYI